MSFLRRLGFGQKTGEKPTNAERKHFMPLNSYGAEYGYLGQTDMADDAATAAMARLAYAQNPVAHRSVRMIVEAAASVHLQLFQADEELTSHRFLDLIRQPNINMAGQEFLEHCYSQLLLDGNCYIQQLTNAENLPETLYSLRPERMRVILDDQGWPAYYEYKIGNKKHLFNQSKGAASTPRHTADLCVVVAVVRYSRCFPGTEHFLSTRHRYTMFAPAPPWRMNAFHFYLGLVSMSLPACRSSAACAAT